MIDPFASINKTLTSIGAQPIKIGTSVAQTAGKPSTKQLVDDLTAEQRQEVEGSIGRNLLSGLGWVGEKLDALTGARALRGILGGDFREALSFIPVLGTFGDELGITSEEDYMDNTGRRLLEKAGMLGENKEGLDWGDVGGFAVDVLLDPANLVTLGGKGAATAALKTLSKTSRGKRILKAAGKTENLAEAGIDAVNAAKGAGINEVGQKYTLKKLLELDEADTPNFVNELVADPNTGQLIRPPGAKSLREELIDTGADLTKELEEMPLRTPMATGLPFMKKGKLFGDYLDPVKTPKRYQAMEKLGYRLDRMGDAARTSRIGRVGGKLFDPRIKAGETHEAAQAKARHTHSVMEAVEGQAKSSLAPLEARLDDSGLFDWRRVQKRAAYSGQKLSKEQSKQIVSDRFQYMQDYLGGYEHVGGARVTPEWDLDYANTTREAYEKGFDSIYNQATEILKKDPNADISDLLIRGNEYQTAIDELKNIKTAQNPQEVLQRNVYQTHKYWDEAEELKAAGQDWVTPDVERIRGGVYGRQAPKIHDDIAPIQKELDELKTFIDDARDYARARGVEVSDLQDDWTLYFPRQSFMFPQDSINPFVKSRHRGHSRNYNLRALDTETVHQAQRSDVLRNLYGGTSLVDDLARASDSQGRAFAGRLLDIQDAQQKTKVAKEMAQEMADWIDTNVYQQAQDLRGREYFDTLLKKDNATGKTLDELDPQKLERMAAHIGEIDPRHATESMPYFEANPVRAVMGYYTDVVKTAHAAETAVDLIAEHADLLQRVGGAVSAPSSPTVLNMLKDQRINTWKARKEIINRLEKNTPLWDGLYNAHKTDLSDDMWDVLGESEEILLKDPDKMRLFDAASEQVLDKLQVDSRLAGDIGRYVKAFTRPDELHEVIAAFDKLTNLFKTSLTTPWPAFHARNLVSAVMNGFYAGAFDPTHSGPKRFTQHYFDFGAIMRGEVPKNIAEQIPMFRRAGLTDQEATEKIKDFLQGYDVVGRRQTREELFGMAEEGELGDFIGRYAAERTGRGAPRGQTTKGSWIPGSEFFKKAYQGFKEPIPSNIPGGIATPDPAFAHLTSGSGRMAKIFDTLATSKASPFTHMRRFARGGRAGAEHIEELVRGAQFTAFLKQGFSPDEAARKVKLAQVDYSALSNFERKVMRRLLPFYSFTRRQVPFLIENLFLEPAGPMAQAVRGYGRIQRESTRDTLVPEYISQTIGIPLPSFMQSGIEGQKRYLTGLGGLLGGAEDLLSIPRPGRGVLDTVGRSARGVGSRMHPLAQIGLESAAGKSMYTGRPLEELKSPTARLLGQLTGSDEPVGTSFLTPETETILQRVPGFGRAVSTLRQLTDYPRAPIVGEEGFSGWNLARRTLPGLTGVRIADVDLERQQNRLLQEIIEDHLRRHPSARTFEHLYFSEEDLLNLPPEQRAMYMLYKQLGKEATQRARTEREQRASAYST